MILSTYKISPSEAAGLGSGGTFYLFGGNDGGQELRSGIGNQESEDRSQESE